MKKYTASYNNIGDNFVILNCDTDHKCDSTLYGLFCVVQNIIQRGAPTIPSKYLREKLGEPENIDGISISLVSTDTPYWNTIKGDDDGIYYPAEHFYYDLLPEYLGEYAIARNFIIPEADFRDVLNRETALDGQQVDFYFPQIRTVIEIDGSSHHVDLQNMKDRRRDDALRKSDIQVIRISTSDIKDETDTFKNIMTELKKTVMEKGVLANVICNDNSDNITGHLKYATVIRLQILLLEMLKQGRILLSDISWDFTFIKSDVDHIEELFRIAYEDLGLWIAAIAQMIKVEYAYPKLNVESKDSGNILIDFGLFKRYTDAEYRYQDCIFVRNDYFVDHNYYCVANAEKLKYSFGPKTEDRDNSSLRYVLNNLFPDLEEFRDGQPQIIKNVLMDNDTIGILPTGTGKSLCYQIAALLQPGVSVVIVPIVSLMIDQQESMFKRHINHVGSISSAVSGEEKDATLQGFRDGHYQFLWISPERFQNQAFRNALAEINLKMNFAFAVIDEVHCLSEWGHDFRVSYLALVRIIREYCPAATLLGLTATASQAVLEDLKAEFEVDGEAVKALTNMDRPELVFHRYRVESVSDKIEYINEIIVDNNKEYINQDGTNHNALGLVFCPTVGGNGNGCNTVYEYVESHFNKEYQQLRLATYHGKLTNAERNAIQSGFMNNDYDLLMCTKAFGMGIDQPNIKYTVHFTMPQSIESFYQEAGRAGRDKDKSVDSHCYILYCPEKHDDVTKKIFDPNTDIIERKELSKELHGDLSTIMWFWNNNKDDRNEEYKRIRQVLSFLYKGETKLAFDNKSGEKICQLQPIQEALYKLSLLGIVSDWTIEYFTLEHGIVLVDYDGINEKKMKEHLLTYIRKYDPLFKIDEKSINYQKYYDMAHDANSKPVTQLINILLEWTNENILNSRLQSTYNMMQWMDPNVSDDEFRRRMSEFFKFSEESVIYNGIIYHPLEYINWFDLLYIRDKDTKLLTKEIITKEVAEDRLAGLQRYLESYRYNTGLNYLSGILRLYTSTFRGTEGEWRLDEAFQSIREALSLQQQDEILEYTYEIARHFSVDAKDTISQILLRYYPDRTSNVFDNIHDRYSLSILLEEPVRKISRIIEEVK